MDSLTSSASQDDELVGNLLYRVRNSDKLDHIWEKCIAKCHSNTLRQLLHAHGKLFSISEVEGALVVYVAFRDEDVKARAERFMSSITNSIEMVLRCNLEVRIILMPDGEDSMNCVNLSELQGQKRAGATLGIEQKRKANGLNPVNGYTDSQQESLKLCRGSSNDLECKLKGGPGDHLKSLILLDSALQSTALSNAENGYVKEERQESPMQRIESIIWEQRLETAWLQAAEKGTPGSLSLLKPEKNQVLPQEDIHHQNKMESASSVSLPSQHWEDELNYELKVLKMEDRRVIHEDQIGKRADCYSSSPSLLNDSNFVGIPIKESLSLLNSILAFGLGCMNQVQQAEVAVGFSVGMPTNLLGRRLASPELLKYARQEQVYAEFKKWEKILIKIHAVLDDAEEKQLTNQFVKIWLAELRDLAYDVDDILDEFTTEAIQRGLIVEPKPAQASSTSLSRLAPA
ncbi:hypothetical protein GH714_020119 [Hevea brasiliensis]|uniref:Uncharacterized protein n=1 Tax=Hevea brasiliensis TaxID=3981 RepID=A0A6A6MY02_HEVBR|nr:hypothetical protein GH714_020119 [Hevea brasiliensis]